MSLLEENGKNFNTKTGSFAFPRVTDCNNFIIFAQNVKFHAHFN